MKKERIGFAFCGSFCTHKKVLEQYLLLTQEYETVIPIVSESAASTDTRFGSAADFLKTVETAAGRSAIRCIRDAEPIGPKKLLDALVIAPCTGNTLAKLSGGVISQRFASVKRLVSFNAARATSDGSHSTCDALQSAISCPSENTSALGVYSNIRCISCVIMLT